MATTKKKATAKKKATPKKKTATARKPKAKRVITSAKVKANNRNFASAVSLATDEIYDAGQSGRTKPTWGQALRAAYRGTSLAGVKKSAGTKRKRAKK